MTVTPAESPTIAPTFDGVPAHLRLANLAPGAGALDVYINGQLSDVRGLGYPTLSEWISIAPGTYTISFTITGTTEPLNEPITLDLASNQWVTVAGIGEVLRGTFTAQPIEEDYTLLSPSEARVTLFHAMPSEPPIDLRLASGEALIQALSFPGSLGDNDGAVTFDISAGTYNMQVLGSISGSLLFDLPEQRLNENRNYFVAAVGLPGNLQLVIDVTDQIEAVSGVSSDAADAGTDAQVDPGAPPEVVGGPTAFLRLANFSPDAPALDVYINGELTDIQGLEFASVTEWLELPAGTYTVAVTPADAPISDALIGPANLSLIGDTRITLITAGLIADSTFAPRVLLEDYREIPAGSVRVTVFHAIADAPALSIRFGDVMVPSLEFPGAGGSGAATVEIPAGTFELGVSTDGDGTALIEPESVELVENNNYLIAVVGELDGEPQIVIANTDQTEP